MDQQSMIAVILVGMLVVGVIFAPPLVKALFEGFRGLFQDFRDSFFGDWGTDDNGWFGEDGNETYGILSMQINYKDGTSRTFEPNPFALMPLTILDGGGEVQSITFDSKATLGYDGTLTSWGALMDLSCVPRTESGGWVDGYLFSENTNPTGTSWISGQEKTLYTKTVQASEIETFMENAGASTGNYYLSISFSINLNVNFADGSSDQTQGNTDIEWLFNYDTIIPMITSFAVSITYSRT